MTTTIIDRIQKKMIAHRGLSGIETENTCSAFVAAANRSYFGIETDVHKTKDGRFVLIHDNTTGRVSEQDFPVEESTYDALREIVLNDRTTQKPRHDLRLPSLEEYAIICLKYQKTAVLELKNEMEKDDIEKIIAILLDCEAADSTIFISFSYQNLRYVREIFPEAKVQFLCKKIDDELTKKLIRDEFDLDIHFKGLEIATVEKLHAAGRRINVWTVDDPADVTRMLDMGVDFITSNICE